jgi:hypothetical protein
MVTVVVTTQIVAVALGALAVRLPASRTFMTVAAN